MIFKTIKNKAFLKSILGFSQILICLFVSSLHAQQEASLTEWKNTYPTSNNLTDCWRFSATEMYVVGNKGFLASSSNAGQTWDIVQMKTNTKFTTVWFTSRDTGFVGCASSYGGIYKTTDGGKTWNNDATISINTGSIYDIYFVNNQLGYASGAFGKIYKTVNGGISWTTTNVGVSNTVAQVQFTSADTGYCYINSDLYKTVNGSNNWTKIYTASSSITTLYFYDADTAYLSTFLGGTLKSTNKGQTWTVMTWMEDNLNDIYFVSPDTGYICSNASPPYCYRTTNAGNTWSIITGNGTNNFYFKSFSFKGQYGMAVGNYGCITQTLDGGQNWQRVHTGVINNYYSVYFLNNQKGFVGGSNGKLLRALNGGQTFDTIPVPTNMKSDYILDIQFIGQDTGFVMFDKGHILRTIDGGNTWTTRRTGTGSTWNFRRMHFLNGSLGYFTGQNGLNAKTLDGGLTLTNIPTGFLRSHYSVQFRDQNIGIVVGDSGRIYRTTNGGANWTRHATGLTNRFLHDVDYLTDEKVVAVGESGIYLTSLDSGKTWTSDLAGWGDNIYDIDFISETEGYFITNQFNGDMYKTLNGGKTWMSFQYKNEQVPYELSYAGHDTVFAVGMLGLIEKVYPMYSPPIVPPVVTICDSGSTTINAQSSLPFVYWYFNTPGNYHYDTTHQFLTPNMTIQDTLVIFGFDSLGFETRSVQCIVKIEATPSAPAIFPMTQTTVCFGDSVILFVSGDHLQWSTGDTTNQLIVKQSGLYSVTESNENCTSPASSIQITVLNPPTPPQLSVSNDTLWAIPSNQPAYQWSIDGQVQTSQLPYLIVSQAGTYAVNYVDTSGCFSSSSTLVITSSLMEEQIQAFKIYPNPAQNELEITAKEAFEIKIFNAEAKLVWTGKSEQQVKKLDIQGFSKGLYVVELKVKGKLCRKSFIKN